MSKTEPTIQKYMTYIPHSIESRETVQKAVSAMKEFNIRHLPVLENGQVIGVVSDRDIKLATSFSGATPELLKVKDICHDHPYQVDPDASLSEVVLEMAEKRYGSALVVQNKKLVGIFTMVDACRALAAVIAQRFHAK